MPSEQSRFLMKTSLTSLFVAIFAIRFAHASVVGSCISIDLSFLSSCINSSLWEDLYNKSGYRKWWILWTFSHITCGINYWRDAHFGLRRNMDMLNIAVGASIGFVQLISTCSLSNCTSVLLLHAAGLALYAQSFIHGNRGRHLRRQYTEFEFDDTSCPKHVANLKAECKQEFQRGVFFHALGLHGFCNAANCFFFYVLCMERH